MFNEWKPFPENKPEKEGRYQCTIKYGKEDYQAFVLDLWWDPILEIWKDNRRLAVFREYDVFGYGHDEVKKLLYNDSLCERDNVIAFMSMPEAYKQI